MDLPVFELAHPIPRVINGKPGDPITHVKVLRRPNLGDLKAVAGHGKFDALGVALGRVTDLPKAFVDQLDADDAIGLSEVLFPLFNAGARTSAEPLPEE